MKRAQWQKWIEEQAGSGESATEYCAKHGLNAGSFSYWKQQLRKSVPTERFVTVGGSGEIEVHLPGGAIIKSELQNLSSILKAVAACAR